MSSGKLIVAVWLSGLLAGVILMERWIRTGKRLIPTPDPPVDVAETPSNDVSAAAHKPKVTAAIAAAAKADAQRVKVLVAKATSHVGHSEPELSTALNGQSA